MTYIPENTFAAACYDQNTIAYLEAALLDEPDLIDMREWNLTADEWRTAIKLALAAKQEDLTAQ